MCETFADVRERPPRKPHKPVQLTCGFGHAFALDGALVAAGDVVPCDTCGVGTAVVLPPSFKDRERQILAELGY